MILSPDTVIPKWVPLGAKFEWMDGWKPERGCSPLNGFQEELYLVWDNFSLALEILNNLIGLLPGDYKEMGSLGPWSSLGVRHEWGAALDPYIFTSEALGAGCNPGHGELDEGPGCCGDQGACTDLQSWSQTANGQWTWFSLRCDERPWEALVQLSFPGLSVLYSLSVKEEFF